MKLVVRVINMLRIDKDKFIERLYKGNFWKRFFMFVMGMLVSALSFNLFYDKYDVVPTGSSGLALLVGQFINVDMSLIILVISLICLLLGLIFFGYAYAIKMLAVTFLYPFFVSATTLITRNVNLEDTSLFLIMVFGGAMMGFSSGLIRKSQFSPGGFCVLFDIASKYLHISVGMATIIVNMILIGASSFVFGLTSALYAVISLLVASYIVDKVIIGISDNKVFYIVTDKPLEVRDYVMDKLHYSVTVVKARGGYSNKRKKMLMCVVPTIEYVKLKEMIKGIDDKAFFLIVDIYESSVKKNCKNM